jgi:hypothetical protein
MARRRKPMSLKKAQRLCRQISAEPADFSRIEAALASQWSTVPAPSDVFWTVANERLLRLAREEKWRELSTVYRMMAMTLYDEERPFDHVLKEAHNAQILEYKSISKTSYGAHYKGVRILSRGCCNECDRLNGGTYTFDQALTEATLPHAECTRGWCNCSWETWISKGR